MIAAGVIGGVFLICTVVMFLGVKEREGEICVCVLCVHSKGENSLSKTDY